MPSVLGNAAGQYAGVQNAAIKNGSLATAFEELNRQISEGEANLKGLFERIQPILEPMPPQPSQTSATVPTPANSPLAETVFEYAARVRQIQLAMSEIVSRISY